MEKMKVVAIVQARLDSSRLPRKVLMKVKKLTLLEILYKRLLKSKKINKIIFAIPGDKVNRELASFLKKKKIKYFLGDKDNVLKRYYYAAKKFKANLVVRVTGDCPLVDPELVDKSIILIKKKC